MAGKVFLVLATIIDLAIAALLIGVSGFMFGQGPESLHAGLWFSIVYMAAVIACVIAPAAAFLLNAAKKPAPAQAAAWLPVAVALVVLVIPAL